MFNQNEGSMDRCARSVLGLALIAGGMTVAGNWGIVLGVVGLVPLITGLTGWCPLYSVFKINTCKIKDA